MKLDKLPVLPGARYGWGLLALELDADALCWVWVWVWAGLRFGEGPRFGYRIEEAGLNAAKKARSKGNVASGPKPLYLKSLKQLSTFMRGAREAVRKKREHGLQPCDVAQWDTFEPAR